MTDRLHEQLQQSLGTAYRLDRELGGGGMSRVFVAEETAFGRRVVVKLLSPELSAGVNVDRFRREIQVAARLQHPHIVPVIAAGESEGLPYYTMPFVDGESLRARLARDGALGVGDTVAILRDVARALDYAHHAGIVHRDIKPDNVLLSRGTAAVADFGIAKALSASKTHESGATLTQLGASIGTPMYMAPEQAAGDPDIDHRADIYAFGCMAYEMLAGRGPFAAKTPQRLLAAHMSETPQPITALRPETPDALAKLVMSCLVKEPAGRPQTAGDLLIALDSATSGQGHAALTVGRVTMRKALAIYVVACIAGVVLVRVAVTTIGLPEWVFPGALVAMALSLPLVLFTGYAQRVARRAHAATPTYTPGGTRATQATGAFATMALNASPHLSWKRVTRWSALVAGTFVVLVGGAMAMRVAGVGPFATLFSAGELQRDRPIVIAEFTLNNSSDTTLGRVIAELVRSDLAESRAITLLPESDSRRALVNMQRPGARMLLPVAREVAQRTGASAVIDGTWNPVGTGFIVTLRMVTADSGRELASFTAAADSPSELIQVVGGLTRKLRGKIGESLKSVQSSPALWQVTTSSLPALQKYMEGRAAINGGKRAEYDRLLKEAIALDSNFAAAYISLASNNINLGANWAETARYLAKVHSLRDRLGDRDRWTGERYYYAFGPAATRDYARSDIYEDSLEMAFTTGPFGALNLHSRALDALSEGDIRTAESHERAAAAMDPSGTLFSTTLMNLQLRDGRLSAAESTVASVRPSFTPDVMFDLDLRLLIARGELARAESLSVPQLAAAATPRRRAEVADRLAALTEQRGEVAESQRYRAIRGAAMEAYGIQATAIVEAAENAELIMWTTGDTTAALRVLDESLKQHPLELLEDLDRPYADLAAAFAIAGRPQRARTYFDALLLQRTEGAPRFGWRVPVTRARIAMAEKRWDDAVRAVAGPLRASCLGCVRLTLGTAYDRRGDADSAIVYYEQYMAPLTLRSAPHAPTARRLGELYEAKGDLPQAIKWYNEFLTTWKHADAALRPQIVDVQQRVARLDARERAKR